MQLSIICISLQDEHYQQNRCACLRRSGLLIRFNPRMHEESKPFVLQSEISGMRGGFGILRSKVSLHFGLTVSERSE